MITSKSLESLFVENKQKLSASLEGLTIPKDAEKIQTLISDHLSKLLLEDGDFRQNLTQSEDYILQAVLVILSAHQARYTCVQKASLEKEISEDGKTVGEESVESIHGDAESSQSGEPDYEQKYSVMPKSLTIPTAAAGVGALAGGVLLGTWGAVCGAIACTAFAAYSVGKSTTTEKTIVTKKIVKEPTFAEKPIDVASILEVIQNLCRSVDEIIVTFRAQINNVVSKYESIEKPTIEREYSTLLENIQSLVGYMRSHAEDEKYIKKLQERIEDLAECLENYNLSLVDYNGANTPWFELVPSVNSTEIKQVYPAIAKANQLIKKGKLFTPEN